jgi:hypothetical protein
MPGMMPNPYPQAMPMPVPYPQPIPYSYPGGSAPMPMPIPYPQPVPYRQPTPNQPIAYYPQNGMAYDPSRGIWLVQNVGPSQQPGGFMPPAPMPFNGMQGTPGGNMMPSFDRFAPIQLPQPPVMGPVQMQLPRMDPAPPPAPPPNNCFPTHPFVRSPRDWFMWGEAMADERARGNRPAPVP